MVTVAAETRRRLHCLYYSKLTYLCMYLVVLFLITNILLFHYKLSFFFLNLISSLNIGGRQGSFVPIQQCQNYKNHPEF